MLSKEPDLIGLYRQFNATHPVRSAAISAGDEIQQWSWIDCGRGDRVVLLLPGFMGEANTNFLYTLALEDHFRVLSVAYPPSARTVDKLCDGIIALLDHVQVSRANVVGGSYSGYLAQVLVRRHPERVKCLVLTHTGLPTEKYAYTSSAFMVLARLLPVWLFRWLMQLSRHFFFLGTSRSSSFWKDHFSEAIRKQDRESMLNRFRIMRDFHRNYDFQKEDLSNWHGSLLIMEMIQDGFTSVAEQAAMRRLYPDAEIYTFPDAKHTDSVDRPEEQIGVIKDFFTRFS